MFSFDRRARLGAAALAVCVPASMLAFTPGAQAVSVGNLSVIPATGHQDTGLFVTTPAACPQGSVSFYTELSGPRITGEPGAEGVFTTSTKPLTDATPNGSGYGVEVSEPLSASFAQQSVTDPEGAYTYRFVCTDFSGFERLGTFDAILNVTNTGVAGDYNLTYAQQSQAVATQTTLAATPLDPVASGAATTLTATVAATDAPAPAGTVQFRRGTANLGTPVAVSGGTATSPAMVLTAGNDNLTAVFTPADPASYAASVSAPLAYVVVGVPAITGTVRVGSAVTCATSVGGTQAISWLKNGVVQSVATKSVTIPSTWYKASIGCRVKVTSNGRVLERSSAAKTVAIGPALRRLTAPKVMGTMRVGRVVSCSPGTWSPTATSYSYTWHRNGVRLVGKTARTYTLTRLDRRKGISCGVTAKRAGYANGVAMSARRTVA
ncbi:Ig-like domain-containing protein [Nocardioides cavernaquae]|uniref:Ig-like domain repeat protein n=1 Tax=Nocardioides cavernaquae TaxID=2321396 RepID=A0A3A5HDT0_9ACTN|nr:Ig-like domain-containing protein [Nocardioides cavernaquae]RJS46194.1 Ig-like domain repeat protein [Nocardioides cavernaquae]